MFNFNKQTQVMVLIILGVLLFAGGVKYAQMRLNSIAPPVLSLPPSQLPTTGQPEKETTISQNEVVVHIAGAVAKPGVYRLPGNARVIDAITQAEPLLTADLDQLNLAAPLRDGERIPVPQKGEKGNNGVGASSGAASGSFNGTGKININTATVRELEELPGIGPSLAARIVQFREKNGNFRVIEDITNVSGIGEGRYNQLKDLISIY